MLRGEASIIIKALEPTAYSFGFAYASGGGSPPAFGFAGKKQVGMRLKETTMWYSAVTTDSNCICTVTAICPPSPP